MSSTAFQAWNGFESPQTEWFQNGPAAPGSFSGAGTNQTVTLTWTAPASDSPVLYYVVSGDHGLANQIIPAGTLTAVYTGLTNGTSYAFSIYAVSAVCAGPSASTSATPSSFSPPANVFLTSADASNMTGWFLHDGVASTLTATDYLGNPNSANAVTLSANNTHQAYTNNATGAYTTIGGAFKAGTGCPFVTLSRNDSGTDYAYFDLSGGTVTSVGTAVGSIHSLGGGWYWCSVVLASAVQTFAKVKFADIVGNVAPGTSWSATGSENPTAGPFAAT